MSAFRCRKVLFHGGTTEPLGGSLAGWIFVIKPPIRMKKRRRMTRTTTAAHTLPSRRLQVADKVASTSHTDDAARASGNCEFVVAKRTSYLYVFFLSSSFLSLCFLCVVLLVFLLCFLRFLFDLIIN